MFVLVYQIEPSSKRPNAAEAASSLIPAAWITSGLRKYRLKQNGLSKPPADDACEAAIRAVNLAIGGSDRTISPRAAIARIASTQVIIPWHREIRDASGDMGRTATLVPFWEARSRAINPREMYHLQTRTSRASRLEPRAKSVLSGRR